LFFFSDDTKYIFDAFGENFESKGKESCEVNLKPKTRNFFGHLSGVISTNLNSVT
jgi:hypothetical protein